MKKLNSRDIIRFADAAYRYLKDFGWRWKDIGFAMVAFQDVHGFKRARALYEFLETAIEASESAESIGVVLGHDLNGCRKKKMLPRSTRYMERIKKEEKEMTKKSVNAVLAIILLALLLASSTAWGLVERCPGDPVRITWQPALDADSYLVSVRENGGPAEPIGETSATEISYVPADDVTTVQAEITSLSSCGDTAGPVMSAVEEVETDRRPTAVDAGTITFGAVSGD